MPANLSALTNALLADPGLKAETSKAQIDKGIAAANTLNTLLLGVIEDKSLNADAIIQPWELTVVSAATYADKNVYVAFLEAHGDDEGSLVTGFHHIQNDGGSLMFRGRNFIDTVADAIYHYGFKINNWRYFNEDGNDNENLNDVAGWLNYFLNGVSTVFGTSRNDEIGSGTYSDYFAAARNETFHAGLGDDKIWADRGNDKVFAGAGNDTSGGGTGHDKLYGEDGNDTLWGDENNDGLYGGNGADTLGGGTGYDWLDGGAGNDIAYGGSANDVVLGGDGEDDLCGETGHDRLEGGNGNDEVSGNEGNDRLYGQNGNDEIHGGDGADRIAGGMGVDELILWENIASADTVVFWAGNSGRHVGWIDCVEGFKSGQDKVELVGMGNISFEKIDFKGNGAASMYFDGLYLRIDTNGDRATDMMIEFMFQDKLAASDFIIS